MILGVLFGSDPTSADPYLHPWLALPIGPQADFTAHLAPTSKNYGRNAQIFAPSGLNLYKRLDANLSVHWPLEEHWSLSGRLDWQYVRILSAQFGGETFGLGDQGLGIHYHLWITSKIQLQFQARLDIPAYRNQFSAREVTPASGNGSYDSTLGGFVGGEIIHLGDMPLRWWAGTGYQVRSAHYSAAVPWHVSVNRSPSPNTYPTGVRFGVIALGHVSLESSEHVRVQSGFHAATGGSYFVGTQAPSFLRIGGSLGYQFKHWAVDIDYSQTLSGQLFSQVSQGGIHLQWVFPNAPTIASDRNPMHQSTERSGNSVEQARILRFNAPLNLVKIDKGSQDGVAVSDVYEIWGEAEPSDANEAVMQKIDRGQSSRTTSRAPNARLIRMGVARVIRVKTDESAMEITEYLRDDWSAHLDRLTAQRKVQQEI